jgi:hypothetical protein
VSTTGIFPMSRKQVLTATTCRCYLCIMTYAGLVNKHRNKIPNRLAALEMMRAMTPEETASPWYQVTCALLLL